MPQEKKGTEDTQEYFIEVEYRVGKFSEEKSYQGQLWFQNFNDRDLFVAATQTVIPALVDAVVPALTGTMVELSKLAGSGAAPKQ